MRFTDRVKYSSNRFIVVLAFFTISAFLLILRLVDLSIIDSDFLNEQGNARSLRHIQIPAYRGMITDRNGKALAVSTPVFSVWINPSQFEIHSKESEYLLKMLKINKEKLKKKVNQIQNLEFMYLRRGISPDRAEEIKNLKISGVYLQKEFRRYYPEGELTSHLIGFTNIDDQGQEGIELAYNEWLRGVPGKRLVQKNRLGQIIREVSVLQDPKAGNDLALSIDIRIQFAAYRELKSAVENYRLQSGSIIVMDTVTGEILAMVNQPTYNPNSYPRLNDEKYRNRSVTDLFEPGSVIKAFSVAAAIESQKFTPESVIETSPGWMVMHGKTIRDFRDYGKLNIADILKVSSNIGVVKLISAISPIAYIDLLKRAGIGEVTACGFPGENPGVIKEQKDFNHTLATIAFGYSLSLTPIQLARAYSIFLGDGKLRAVTLLRRSKVPEMSTVLSEKTSKIMLQLLEQVTKKGGTGKNAAVEGYRVAGKTGTARILTENKYDKNRHIGSFVGIAPVSKPRVIVAVVLQDPKGSLYYGGRIAAPVFARVMSETLRILDVQPDNINIAR